MIVVEPVALPEVKKIQLKSFGDERGFFVEMYRKPLYEEKGITTSFVQDNHSFSVQGTVRGMHFQTGKGQAKLVTVLLGEICDVFVDIRPDSPTFRQWGSYVLSAEKHEQLFIPEGFAHGFAVLSETAHICYKVSTVYDPETEKGFRFDDPSIGIEWPVENPVLSEKDRAAPLLDEVIS